MTVTELPVVQSFPSSAPPDEVVEAIKLSGGCIIKGLLSNSDIKQIEQDIRPYIEADVPWVGKFFPRETRRVYGLVGKSETVAQKLVLNPLYQAVSDVFLKERYWNWSGDEKMQNISHPQLHNSIAFSIGPGAKAQPLHRDDHCHLVLNPRIDVYPEDPAQSRRDTALGLFVAGKRATKENGATRFIPGSHLWEHERQPDEGLTVYAELEPGDAFIMLASCYHGGSSNQTQYEERLIYSCFMTRGYLRQEENQYLALPIEQVRAWPLELQKTIGYQLSQPFCGWVEGKDPRCVIDSSITAMEV